MIDLHTFGNIMREVREDKDLLDSLSPNQFKSKIELVNQINSMNILNKDSEIVIFGGWYGSILIPALYDKVKKITVIDQDKKVISKAKYKIFDTYDVEFIADDIFLNYRNQYQNTDLFINTSCEHMRPMKEWGPEGPRSKFKDNKFGVPQTHKTAWWKRVAPAYFAFQSNNMYDIPTHINCVSSIEEFKSQLPDNSKVLHQQEIEDSRGTRYMIIGQIT